MSFRFLSASCVAVGTFNIYIIQPQWLAQMDVWPKGAKCLIQTDLIRPGFQFHRIENDPLRWRVRPESLVVETSEFGADCGKPIADVLQHLHWTRIEAVGSNESYSCPVADASDLIDRMLSLGGGPPEGYADSQRSWHRAFKRSDTVTNVQLSVNPADDKATVALNVHTDVTHQGSQAEVTQMAQDTCRLFREQLAEARELASNLLSVELENELVNAS